MSKNELKQNKKKHPKIIGLFGTAQTDICIYMASILQNLGHHVCVIDNSLEQAMKYCIPAPVEKLPVITYKYIDYTRLIPVSEWKEQSYDELLVDMGVWPSDEALHACDEIYLVLDAAIAQLDRYRELMKRVAIPMSVILRDICADAVSPRHILNLLQEENCFVVESYILPLHEEDMAGRFAMQYQGYQSFSRISAPFEKMLVKMCRDLTQADTAEIWQSYKRARKGACA